MNHRQTTHRFRRVACFALALLAWVLPSRGAGLALPATPRALTYPLDARRDGHVFAPEAVVRWCGQAGLNLLVVSVCQGPAADDAKSLLPVAAAAGLPVVVAPVPGTTDTVAALAKQFGAQQPSGWAVPADAGVSLPKGVPSIGLTTGETEPGACDILWYTPNGLLQPGLSIADWARGVARLRDAHSQPIWATVSCLPPDWFVAQGCLPSKAEHPDLFATARLRPESVTALAGEYLLLPEPAQIRLQTYAALGSGACGVVFDGPGHLIGYGPEPFTNHDRAAAAVQLCRELALFEPFLTSTEPPDTVTAPGADVGVRSVGDRHLALVWRNRPADSCLVGGGIVEGLTLDAPTDKVPARVDIIGPGGVQPMPVDQRDGGTRLPIRRLDVTAAVAMGPADGAHAKWLASVGETLNGTLPATAARLRTLAMSHLAKVVHTVDRLSHVAADSPGRAALTAARGLIDESGQAISLGYQRSAVDLALEADRMVRTVASVEFEAAKHAAERADPRAVLTLATLPYLDKPLTYRDLNLPALPLEVTAAAAADGAIPLGWQALSGYDQTVATLRARGGALVWTPAGADPGVLSLPFAAAAGLRVEVEMELPESPRGARMVLVAAGPGASPAGGVVVRPDGTLSGWPAGGEAGAWQPGHRFTVAIALRGGRLTTGCDKALIGTPRAVRGTLGALLLAKSAGDDPLPLRLWRISIKPEGM